jgi:hypothetical protein
MLQYRALCPRHTDQPARCKERLVVAKPRTDLMVARLRDLQASSPDVEASAVVSVDGASAVTVTVSVRTASDMFALTSVVPPTVSATLSRRAGLKLSSAKVTV